ncbi:hypothetical protein ABNF97_24175 [Plantactinospora sp. B6F1]|uniref:hypothetical protein n=1 Tax=Plantactinospora sp. B6F1 TaxID=3158971 RepID=UPI0032D92818
MNGRLLLLHTRARGGPAFALGVAVVAPLAWAAGSWLASRPYFDGPAARIPVVALAPLLGVLLLAPTLGGADEELERGTSLRWPGWRAGHILLGVASIGAALALTGLHAPGVFGAYAMVRNTLGYAGLVAAAAVLLGTRLAWLPAFGYACAVYAARPRQIGGVAGVWAWPLQPSGVTASWLTVAVLFIFGTAGYLHRGCRIGPVAG